MPLSIVQKTKSMFPSLTGGYIKNTNSEPSSSKEDLGGLKDGSDDDNDDDNDDSGDTDDEDEDEDVMEWENVFHDTIEPTSSTSALSSSKEMGDLQLTLQNNRAGSLTGQNKRGASAQQRRIRMVTHCLHVQFLLFYGATRNGWICDLELHAILLSHLNPSIMRDVEKYQARQSKKSNKQAVTKKAVDPLLKLLGALIHWWKKKYIVDKPGMRKHGYKTLSQFQEEQDQAEDKFQFTTGNTGKDGQETYTSFKNQGERVRGLEGFKKLATECKGSRDTGAILFTALLRAIGLEARMVFSLQPLGFGFTERENFREVGSTKEEEIDKAQRKEAATGNRKGKSKVEEAITSDDDTGNEREIFAFEESTLDVFRKPQKLAHDTDLKYPIFWSEVYSSTAGKWITVESLVYTVLGSSPDLLAKFEPKGKKAVDSKQVIAYVVSYSPDGTAKDVTVRYLHKNIFPGKTKGFRIPTTKIPVYDYEGKVVGINNRDWFGTVLRGYRTPEHLRTDREQGEDNELQKFISKSKEAKGRQKESITFYKNNPYYVLERHLKREEAVKPGKIHLKIFTVGKGDKVKDEKVYSKEDIAVCKTVENWYREGRVIKEGQQPLKIVKPRAATLNRKREIEEAKRDGEIIMQGLYSEDQTKPYSPPPIVDGRIPRNSFGNIDIYVPSMIPLGAIHLSLIGSANVAKRLGIDYAEAVTGFEFKKQRAVPLVQGVIIATENEGLLRDAWRAEKEEKKKRADEKREKAALTMWWRFLKGLRIVRRLSRMYEDVEYGEVESNPFTARKSYTVCEKNLSQGELDNKSKEGGRFPSEREQNYEMSGGFIGGDRNEAYGADDFSNGEEAIATGSDFGEDEPPRDTDLSIASANSHNNLMSLSGMVSQREIQPSEGSAKPGSEKETQWPTTSPEVRSYLMNIASNDVREGVGEGKAPAISSNGKNRASEVPGEVEPKPCAKVTIEVQIPIPKALPGQNIRGSKINRVPALDSAPNIRPTSGGTRRTPKRKATAEVGRKPNKYLKNDGSSSSDGGAKWGQTNCKNE